LLVPLAGIHSLYLCSPSPFAPGLAHSSKLCLHQERSVTSNFVNAPGDTGGFANTVAIDHWFADVEVGAIVFGWEQLNLSASYQGHFSEHTTLNGANLKMELKF